jgi:Co/Zn/Cd efflux system component
MPDVTVTTLKTWWTEKEKVSDNIKSLALSAALFTTISVVQIIYARQVNSIALLSDAAAMFVDVACYLAAIMAECIPAHRARLKRRFELGVSLVSLVTLLSIAIYYMYQASANLVDIMDMRRARQASMALGNTLPNHDPYGRNSQGMVINGLPDVVAHLESLNSSDGSTTTNAPVKDGWNFNGIGALMYRGILPVNVNVVDLCANVGPGDSCDGDDAAESGVILLVFGLLGLAMDVTALAYAFFLKQQHCWTCTSLCGDDENEEEEQGGIEIEMDDIEIDDEEEEEGDEHDLNLNTLAALAHVAADLIRSVATVLAACYIIARPGWASSGADDFAGLISSVTIAVGSIYGLYLWLVDLNDLRQNPLGGYRKEDGDVDDDDKQDMTLNLTENEHQEDYDNANDEEELEPTSNRNLGGGTTTDMDDDNSSLETPLLDKAGGQ